MLTDWFVRLRSLLFRRRVEQDLDDELRFHIEHQLERYVGSGMPKEEALRRVRIEFGGIDQVKEEHRDARGVRLIEDLWRDVKYAIRHLWRSMSAQGRMAGALRVSASSTEDRRWRQFRSVLVTLEIAMAVAILIAATTLVRTVGVLMAVDIGPRNDTALVMEITLPRANYSSTAQVRRFYQRLRDELRAVPGLETAGATNHLPGSSTVITPSQPMALEGRPGPPGRAGGNALRLSATPGYLSALGIDVLAGREFSDADREGTTPRAIVSEGYARAFGMKPHDMLGRRVSVGLGDVQWAEVVGVVRDVRMRGPESALQPAVYIPFAPAATSLRAE